MRLILLALFLFAALPAAGAWAAGETAPMPRPSVTVEGDVVRLGDIFADAGEKAEVAVLRAPAPGHRLVLKADWLARAARAYGLAWRPLSREDRVVVRRASLVLDREDVEAALRPALARHGIDESADIELSPRDLRLHLPVDSGGRLSVSELAVDGDTGRFTATLLTPQRSLRIAGRAYETVEIPVVAERIRRGEVIGADDVVWQSMRRNRLQSDVVLDAAALVGKAARYGLRPGMPVREREVQEPVVVPRGAVVTMVLRRPGMTLTAQGRALENGAQGEVIRVTNLNSNVTVEARVEGPNRVAALPPSLAAASVE